MAKRSQYRGFLVEYDADWTVIYHAWKDDILLGAMTRVDIERAIDRHLSQSNEQEQASLEMGGLSKPSKRRPAWAQVEQHNNPKWVVCPTHDLRLIELWSKEFAGQNQWKYRVLQTKNTIAVSIGQWLHADELQNLIDNGVDVSVVKAK